MANLARAHPPLSAGSVQKSCTEDVVTIPWVGGANPVGARQAKNVEMGELGLYPA